jgi:TetR/AcrR family transcriptional regulator, cholesterol catabolism regulator
MAPKERILHAAAELFFRYGIKSITMDEIAKHLSMSKKTIYQFFRDKDEIVHELLAKDLRQHMCDFTEISKTSNNVVEEVFLHMKKMHAMFSNINPNIFYDLRKHHPKTWSMFHDFRCNYAYEMVKTALDRGKEQGFVRQDIDTGLMAKFRVEQMDLAFNPDLFPPDKYRILDVQLAFTEHFLYGICTLKGHKLINKHKQITEEE